MDIIWSQESIHFLGCYADDTAPAASNVLNDLRVSIKTSCVELKVQMNPPNSIDFWG